MKTVKYHRYAKKKHVNVYAQPSPGGEIVGSISLDSWIGVVEQYGLMYRVITAVHDGWVFVEDTKSDFDLKLSIMRSFYSGVQPQYGLTA